MCSTATELLTSLGSSVLTAENGERGLAVFQAHRDTIRLVLLDLTMPVMDGAETLDALLALDPDLPIILSSGYDAQDTMRRIGGAPTLLQKPLQASPRGFGEVRRRLARPSLTPGVGRGVDRRRRAVRLLLLSRRGAS